MINPNYEIDFSYEIFNKANLRCVSKLSCRLQKEFTFCNLVINSKFISSIFNSLAHIQCIVFKNVLIDHDSGQKVNRKTRYKLSTIKFMDCKNLIFK